MLYGYEAVKDGFDMPVSLMMYREIFGADGSRSPLCSPKQTPPTPLCE